MRSNDLTFHAQSRQQQRGISETQIELLHYFGKDHYQKGGCSLVHIPEKKLNQLRQAIDKLNNIALVKSPGERVITCMHKSRRLETTEYVA